MERARRLFLLVFRPAGGLVPLVAFGIAAAATHSTTLDRFAVVSAVSAGLSVVYVLLLRRLRAEHVVAVVAVADALLLTSVPIVAGRLDTTDVVFFWPIATAAFLAGPLTTTAATLIAIAATVALPLLTSTTGGLVAETLDVVAFTVIGGALAAAGTASQSAQRRVATDAELNAAALRIAARVRSSLDFDEIMAATAEEIGRATGATRGIVRVIFDGAATHQWVRPGVDPVPAEDMRGANLVRRTGGITLVRDRDDPSTPPDVREYMERYDVRSMIGVPVGWGEQAGALLGLHDDGRRAWDAEIALLERIAPQVRVALGQAVAFRRERQLAQMRETLVANVSHELRTPLTSTLGFLQTLSRSDLDLDEEGRHELLQIATREAERLAALVEDLLSLSSAGAWELDPRPIDVLPVVERAASGLRFPGDRRLHVDVPGDVRVSADERRLLQVLTNLLANAVAHGTGDVTVAARPLASAVEIAVSDEGPPLDAQLAERIFAPFERGRTDGAGTGLGLAISRALVEAHGGELRYERGAFRISLPTADATPMNASDTIQNASSFQR